MFQSPKTLWAIEEYFQELHPLFITQFNNLLALFIEDPSRNRSLEAKTLFCLSREMKQKAFFRKTN